MSFFLFYLYFTLPSKNQRQFPTSSLLEEIIGSGNTCTGMCYRAIQEIKLHKAYHCKGARTVVDEPIFEYTL